MIRIATTADISAILSIYGPYVLNTACTFEYTVPTPEEFAQRFCSYTRQFPWLVWEENVQVLGYAYASAPFSRAAYQWCCEVSVYLHYGAQGRGIGSRLYDALEAIVLRQGYRVIYALVTTENTHSVDFHQRRGYRQVMVMPDCGVKFGRWIGIVYLEKRADIVDVPSEPPRSWSNIVENDRNFLKNLDIFPLSY